MSERRSRRKPDWPALMQPATAQAYLDDMPTAEFDATVAPWLDLRTGGNCLRYTRESIDAWIDAGRRPGELSTPAELARLLDRDSASDDDSSPRRRQRLRQ